MPIMIPVYDYTDEAKLVVNLEGSLDGMERSTGNVPDYFDDNQRVNFQVVDKNSSTKTSVNGKLDVTTEFGDFELYVGRAQEGEEIHVNVPNWAGEVKKVEFVGFASVEGGSRHENIDVVATLDAA